MLESFLVTQKNVKDKVKVAAQVVKNLSSASKSSKDISAKMDEILSHPMDYAKNKEIAQSILKMIENDPDISTEDKVLIQITTSGYHL